MLDNKEFTISRTGIHIISVRGWRGLEGDRVYVLNGVGWTVISLEA